jgi:Tol biopolymer transport system component
MASDRQLIIYTLPDLRLVTSLPWSTLPEFLDISWSSQGHQLAYLEKGSSNQGLLTIINADSGQHISTIIAPDLHDFVANGAGFISWSPDDDYISVRNDVRLDVYDVKNRTTKNVADGVYLAWDDGGENRVLWAGRHLLYLPNQYSFGEIRAYDPDTNQYAIISTDAAQSIIHYPDNNYAVLSYPLIGKEGRSLTVLENMQTQRTVPITIDGTAAKFVSWLDGRNEVVFGLGNKLLITKLDGSDQRTVNLTNVPYISWQIIFSQVGQWLAYNNIMDDNSSQIGVINLETGEQRSLGKLTNGFGNIFLSPDASELAFEQDSSNNRGVTLILYPTNGAQPHTFHTDAGNYSSHIWSSDSTKIALITHIYGQKTTVHILTAEGKLLKQFELGPPDMSFTLWNDCQIP